MVIEIRQEIIRDYPEVFEVVKRAFEKEVFSDHQEQFLVEKLRQTEAFIPELSLVAIYQKKIVGHILLTKIQINNEGGNFDALALAPVSVLPEFQGKGIGGRLIKAAHQRATQLGHKAIILLGHATYYPKFGYQPAHTFGINLPFEVPKENCMAVELVENGLKGIQGTVQYSKAFYE